MATERIDIVVAENGSRTVRRNLNEVGKAGKDAGSMVDTLKRSLLGLGIGAAFLKAARDIGAFANAMAEVSTLVDTAEVSMSQLNATALEQAGLYGSMPVEQAKALYQIISAGASDAATANEQLDAANRLAIGGVTDVATAADGLTSAMNAYGPAIENATAATDAMFVAMKAGKTTIGELSNSIGVVAPLAAAAGVSFDELMASAAALTKGGVTTNVAMTGLRAVMAAVVKPSSEASAMAKQLGIDFSAAALKTQGFAGFMGELKEKTQGNPEVLAQLFGGVEALVPVMALVGKGGDDMNAILEDMADKGGATAEAFEKMANSPGFQMSRVMAALTSEVIKLGQGLVSFVVPALRFLADHMDAIFIIGKGLALAFAWRFIAAAAVTNLIGPFMALRAAFGTTAAMSALFSVSMDSARAAVNRFTMALLANPFTALFVAITLVVAAIVSFGKHIAVTEDGAVSLKDAFFGALSIIADLVRVVAGGFLTAWDATIGAVTGFIESFGVSWSDIFEGVWNVVKFVLNLVLAYFKFVFNTIQVMWDNFPGYMDLIFTGVLNFAAVAAEKLINIWQKPFNFIANGLSLISDEGAAAMRGFLSATKIEVPRAKLSSAGTEAAQAIQAGFNDAFGAANFDRVGAFGAEAIRRGRGIAAERAAAEAADNATDDALTGGAGSETGAGNAVRDAQRDAETRIGYLTRITEESERAVSQARIFDSEMRNVQAAILGVNDYMEDKDWAVLTPAEQAELRERLILQEEENRLMRVRDSIMDAARGPARAYEDHLKAATQLRQAEVISLEEYTEALRQAERAKLEASKDAGSGIMLGRMNVEDSNNDVGGRIASAYTREYDAANGAMRDLHDRQVVLQQLMRDDPINAGVYAQSLREAGLEALILKGNLPDATIFDGMRAGLARFAQDFKGILPGLGQAWGDWAQKIGDGFADAIGRAIVYGENLEDALLNVAQSAMAELISSLVKLGIQWLIMQVIGQTAQAALTATGVAAGGTMAAAWAPAAAMVSLATFGANSAPAMAGMAATNALAIGMAAAGAGGFKEGGYTGNMGVSDVAGVVHGQEFVVNASATKAWLPLLEDINAGRNPMGYMNGGYVGKPRSAQITGSRGGLEPANSNVGGDTFHLNIDARGAEAGVEEKINAALNEALPFFLAKARKQEAKVNQARQRQSIGG